MSNMYFWGYMPDRISMDMITMKLGHRGFELNDKSPQKIINQQPFSEICFSLNLGAGIRSGNLYMWGKYTPGLFSNNTSDQRDIYRLLPDEINMGQGNWEKICHFGSSNRDYPINYVNNKDYFLAINSGKLYFWGEEENIQGNISEIQSTPVTEFTQCGQGESWENGWQDIQAGYKFAVGIRDGKLYSWGINQNGRTGQGVTSGSTDIPTQITAFDDWEKISVGQAHVLAIRSGGLLYSWGAYVNTTSGSAFISSQPTQIGSETDWTHISASGPNWMSDTTWNTHSLGLRSGGSLFAWGAGNSHQTGTGSTTVQTSPVNLNVNNCIDVTANSQSSQVILSNGNRVVFGRITKLGVGRIPIDAGRDWSTNAKITYPTPVELTDELISWSKIYKTNQDFFFGGIGNI
jgi:alpha-tubulin suppressor-like RCC1 family protein